MSGRATETLCAVTCYFNPVGYRRRAHNYHIFRRHLAVPLVTVELAFEGDFELRQDDADVLVQIRGGDVMWQKERLLNLALGSLPRGCDKVAWLDCDIVFESDAWVEEADRMLDRYALVHLFRERYDLPPDLLPDRVEAAASLRPAVSVVHKLVSGEATPEDLYRANAPVERKSTAGLAWASRRSVLEKHGLYDACITGSGDRVILCAALGEFGYGARAGLMTPRGREHYLEWARPYHSTVRGQVGCVPGRIFHLWHGEIVERCYEERHRGLAAVDFDPFTDISIARNGAWRWSSDKTALHVFLRRYFEQRREDGAGSAVGTWGRVKPQAGPTGTVRSEAGT